MKKIFTICVLAFLAFSSPLKSQTYQILPNDTLVVTAPYNTITIFDIYQQNISGAPLNLGWTLIQNGLVAGWDFSLCDYTTCYAGFPASGTMTTVPDSGQGFLGVNVDPTNISGTGIVRFYVFDVTDPNGGDTLTWNISTPPVGIDDFMSVAQLSVYPNPATSDVFVNVTGSTANGVVTVNDVAGRVVAGGIQTAPGNFRVDVATLPAGNYILVYTDRDGVTEQRRLIITR